MNIKELIKRIIYPNRHSSSAFISYLQGRGISVGEGTHFWDPVSTIVDVQRPHMLKIGRNVKITAGVTILTHDYSRSTAFQATGKYAGEAGQTYIGDNTFIGINAIILMGTSIGKNCIVGAGAVVCGNIPDGSVVAGNPARIICSISEFADKRKQRELKAAVEYAQAWKKAKGSWPDVEEMTNAFAWIYLPHSMETVRKYPDLFKLTSVNRDELIDAFLKSAPLFSSFESFIDYCNEADGPSVKAGGNR